jgi:hypothetical protein
LSGGSRRLGKVSSNLNSAKEEKPLDLECLKNAYLLELPLAVFRAGKLSRIYNAGWGGQLTPEVEV